MSSSIGYHVADIPRGVYGSVSKVVEEALEAADAVNQECRLMLLIELSDVIGAIRGVLDTEFNSEISMDDLVHMSLVTARAFKAGTRA